MGLRCDHCDTAIEEAVGGHQAGTLVRMESRSVLAQPWPTGQTGITSESVNQFPLVLCASCQRTMSAEVAGVVGRYRVPMRPGQDT